MLYQVGHHNTGAASYRQICGNQGICADLHEIIIYIGFDFVILYCFLFHNFFFNFLYIFCQYLRIKSKLEIV